MSTTKRVSGNYTIKLLDSLDHVTIDSGATTITGDLTVLGNTSISNVSVTQITNGTSNVRVNSSGGNVTVGIEIGRAHV